MNLFKRSFLLLFDDFLAFIGSNGSGVEGSGGGAWANLASVRYGFVVDLQLVLVLSLMSLQSCTST